MVKYMEKNLDKTKPRYIANNSVGLLILSLKLSSWRGLVKMIRCKTKMKNKDKITYKLQYKLSKDTIRF